MERKKLIFLDIDGTLTPAGSNVPPRSAQNAVRAARKNGHKVFLCTGRNPAMLAPVLAYGFDGAVSLAGGYIFCGSEVIYDCPMTELQRDTALTLLHREGVFCTLEARDATYGDESLDSFLSAAPAGNSEIERWRRALAEDLGILPMSQYDGRPAYKVVFMCTDARQLAPAKAALEQEFLFCAQQVEAHGCLNGELINRAFDKGRGVLRVCSRLGFSAEDTIGFGDSMNDLEMIETVGFGVCMENGSDALKARSDLICPSVEQDGLASAFAQLGLI